MNVRTLSLAGAACVLAAALVLGPAARAEAPPGRYVLTSGTALDTHTGLMWQRAATTTTYDHAGALAYCQSLSLEGHTDWRLPTRAEALSVADRTRWNPALDPNVFSGAVGGYWTSTSSARNSDNAWVVSTYYGNGGLSPKTTTVRLRCVR